MGQFTYHPDQNYKGKMKYMNTMLKYLPPINKELLLFIKFRLSMNSYKLCLEKLIKI